MLRQGLPCNAPQGGRPPGGRVTGVAWESSGGLPLPPLA
jgi:hypothetical protein